MKVKKIIPCVCIKHFPNSCENAQYGMPDIAVSQGEYYSCYCRNCGRGSRCSDYVSSYKALKDWNRLQKELWEIRCNKHWLNEYKEDIEPWEVKVMEEFVNSE